MLLFIDDVKRHPAEYILNYKSEALWKFKEWKVLREKDSGKQVTRFRTDGGSKYTSKKFAECLKSAGILKETTTPYTPQAKGVFEWANRTIMERVQCLLDDAGLSTTYWAFAVSVGFYIMHHTPKRWVVGKTPYQAGHGKQISLKHLRVFGCLVLVHVPKEKRQKLDYRVTPGIFVGYSISTKQYFVYDQLAKMLDHSQDVVFRQGKRYTALNAADEAMLNEHIYSDVIEEPEPTEMQPTRDESSERQTGESLHESPPDPPKPKKKSRELAGLETSLGDAWKTPAKDNRRNHAGKDSFAESAQLAIEDEQFEHMIPIYAAAAISDDHEDAIDPQSDQAATQSPLAEQCDKVMKEELDAIGQHHSLEISLSFRKGEMLCQVTGYTRSSMMEQEMCSSSRPG